MENNQELENYDDEKKLVLAVDDEESIEEERVGWSYLE